MKIAITGGMGCGKSTIINMLSEMLPKSYCFASYDAEVQRMYERDWCFRDALRHHFGTDDRGAVSRIVFGNPERLDLLQKLAMPPLQHRMQYLTSTPDVLMEVPMLFQIPGAPVMFEKVIAICCDRETQKKRIRQRDAIPEAVIEAKLANQWPLEEIAERADFVIDTNEGAVDVRVQLEPIVRIIQL